MKTIHFISEKNIIVRKSEYEDFQFLFECFKSKDYKKFISRDTSLINDYYLLISKNNRIGCALFVIDNSMGLCKLQFTFFVKEEHRLLVPSAIFSCFNYIINNFCMIEKIEMRVYECNELCIKVFNFFNIEPEISIPCTLNGVQTHLLYYAIFKDKLVEFADKVSGRFEND